MTNFAFYGRVSTEDQQDPASSRNWQLARSRQIIEQVSGDVVTEFFDIGQSRSLPWKRRPESARLLETFADPGRGFDAVVIGEPQRAFYGNQFGLTFPVFVHYGIELWVPEVGGRVDPGSDAHELVMSLYGGMSKGERNRIKTRVRTAMSAQASVEGRFLGGRPPYGYMLGDAGPHPNPSKAAIGQRLHLLVPDPIVSANVGRIFDEFIAGKGLYAIAETLTSEGILSPSGHDPKRNRHRASSGGAWSKHAVKVILQNARYTGREVWNKQRRDEVLIDVDDVALGHESKMRWNDEADWVWSQEQTHEPLVTLEQFEAARDVFDSGQRAAVRKTKTRHPYMLSGLMRCGLCGRRMQASWNNSKAYYRCKFPSEYAVAEDKHPKTVYVREIAVLPGLDQWIGQLFDEDHIEATCQALSVASTTDLDDQPERAIALQRQIKECDSKLKKYRELLETQPDIAVVGTWISEVERERQKLQRQLSVRPKNQSMTTTEIRDLVEQLRDIVGVLANASTADRRAVYDELGVSLTYHPETKSIEVGAGAPHVLRVGVGGGECNP